MNHRWPAAKRRPVSLPAEDQLEAARALAEAQLELTRIREAKAAATPTGLDQMLDPEALKEPVRAWPL